MKTVEWTDPIVDEIHRVREELMREADYDPREFARRARATAERLGFKGVTRIKKLSDLEHSDSFQAPRGGTPE